MFTKDKAEGFVPTDTQSMELFDKVPEGYYIEIHYKDGRTVGQNALFHRWCREIAKHFYDGGKTHFGCGNEMNELNMKENLKKTYLGFEVKTYTDLVTGEITETNELRKTSELDKGDFTAFLMLVDAFCVEYGIVIARPEDSEYMQILRELGEAV